jgi:hypothetical protein
MSSPLLFFTPKINLSIHFSLKWIFKVNTIIDSFGIVFKIF